MCPYPRGPRAMSGQPPHVDPPSRPRGLAFYASHGNAHGKAADRRPAAAHAVTPIFAQAAAVEEARHRNLEALCESIDVAAGQLWSLEDSGEAFRCAAVWTAAAESAAL